MGRGKDLTPYLRGRIEEARGQGMKIPDIIKKFEISRKAVRSILE
jgi:hypothetical protein